MQAAASGQGAAPVDPAAARKAEDEAEERRLAEIRSHGTMVTPQTFAEWKQRFDAEMALQKGCLQGKPAATLRSEQRHAESESESTATLYLQVQWNNSLPRLRPRIACGDFLRLYHG